MKTAALILVSISIACGGSANHASAPAATEPRADLEQAPAVRYITELNRRIYASWKIPSSSAGTVAVACVRLDPMGAITESAVTRPSGDATFDRSIEIAIRDTPGMDAPVPSELHPFLVTAGICLQFAAP